MNILNKYGLKLKDKKRDIWKREIFNGQQKKKLWKKILLVLLVLFILWLILVARRFIIITKLVNKAHNPKVVSSSLSTATKI